MRSIVNSSRNRLLTLWFYDFDLFWCSVSLAIIKASSCFGAIVWFLPYAARMRPQGKVRAKRQGCLPLSLWGYCYCFCEPGFWIRCVLVSFLAVSAGLDLNTWDWSLGPRGCYWIGFGGVHLGLVLDWFWAGIRPKTLIKFSFARGKKQRRLFMRILGQNLPFVPRAKQDLDEGFSPYWIAIGFVRPYWIGLGERRIGFGLVSGRAGELLDWIHFEWNATGLDAPLDWIP